MMFVKELMTSNPRVCAKEASLDDAARIMWEADCGMVPIAERVDGRDRLVGVVTDRDVSMAAHRSGQSLKELPIEQVMSRNVRTCGPADPVDAAAKAMREARVRRLPVVDGAGSILGVLSLSDLAREVGRRNRRKRRRLVDAELAITLGAISASRSAMVP